MNEWKQEEKKNSIKWNHKKKVFKSKKKNDDNFNSDMIIIIIWGWCLPTAVCLFGYDYFW